jgi:hypothetical protein
MYRCMLRPQSSYNLIFNVNQNPRTNLRFKHCNAFLYIRLLTGFIFATAGVERLCGVVDDRHSQDFIDTPICLCTCQFGKESLSKYYKEYGECNESCMM